MNNYNIENTNLISLNVKNLTTINGGSPASREQGHKDGAALRGYLDDLGALVLARELFRFITKI